MDIKPPSQSTYSSLSSVKSTNSTKNVQNTQNLNNSTANSVPSSWKISQLLEAVIEQVTDKQLMLNIRGIRAHAEKPLLTGLQVGDTLKLQIEKVIPSPEFRILGVQKALQPPFDGGQIKPLRLMHDEMKPLLNNISYIANRPALRPAPLDVKVNNMVRDIFKQLPAPYNLKTATQLKTQLENSGLFIASKLKHGVLQTIKQQNSHLSPAMENNLNTVFKNILDQDLGTQLHRLANLIKSQSPTMQSNTAHPNTAKPEPPVSATQQQIIKANSEQASLQNITQREESMRTFLRQVESSLNQIQQNQLQNLNDSQAHKPTWIFELPIKDRLDIDLFKIKINEEEQNQAQYEEGKIWSVTLEFKLAQLGEMKANIRMQNEKISTRFFSDNNNTLNLFTNNIDYLRSRLNHSGLQVNELECRKANFEQENNS